jgi:hypothetical protein
MGLTNLIAELDSFLKTGEKELEALHNLLLNGRISQSTYDLVEKKVNQKKTLVSELKEALKSEEDYWRNSLSDATKIFECLLVEFKHRHFLGEIGEGELKQKSSIINLGLESLLGKDSSVITVIQEPAQPLQMTLEQHTIPEDIPKQETLVTEEPEIVEEEPIPKKPISEEPVALPVMVEEKVDVKLVQPKKPSNGGQAPNKRRKPSTKESPEVDSSIDSSVHCMNPWKPDCRNTDIELSIYYKEHSIPICRKCWEEISDKNIEW